MSSTTVENLNTCIAKMMCSLDINNYEIDFGGSSIKGDGYLGEITFLKVHATKNGTKTVYDLVIKSAKQSEELRKQTPVKEAYDREMLFYSKIWPILDNFQKEKQVRNPFSCIPKCFYISEELTKEAVVLENLKSLNFDLHDRQQPMNLKHVLMVVQNYGKYHALSLAYRHQYPASFKNLTKNMSDIFGEFILRMDLCDCFIDVFNNLRKKLKEAGEMQVLKKFDNFEKEFEKVLVNYTDDKSELNCLIHADCWSSNFMFKYEDEQKTNPIDMRFIDFQFCRIGSPIIDLSYFLYSCGDKKIFDYFDCILQIYHCSLTSFLIELGFDPEIGFSYEKLRECWKDHGRYGIALVLLVVKLSLCESTEAPDLIEVAENGDFKQIFSVHITDLDYYYERMKNIYIHFAKEFL